MDRLVKIDVTVLSITVDVMSDTLFLNMLDFFVYFLHKLSDVLYYKTGTSTKYVTLDHKTSH